MTAKEYLFSKYPLVSPEWFNDNELTQEMIKMMQEYSDQQTKKYKEMVEEQDKLINLIDIYADQSSLTFNNAEDRVLFFEGILRNEVSLRDKIKQLKSEIQ